MVSWNYAIPNYPTFLPTLHWLRLLVIQARLTTLLPTAFLPLLHVSNYFTPTLFPICRNQHSGLTLSSAPFLITLKTQIRKLSGGLGKLIFCLQFVSFPSPVPTDGLKGKTWGPSTVHQKERAHIWPVANSEGQRQWSRFQSAPNLEKTQKGLLAATAAAGQGGRPVLSASATLPDLGKCLTALLSYF